jgi:GTP cyclohydrolase IA
VVDKAKVEAAVLELLTAVGEDPNREGLKRTPERVGSAYAEWFKGYAMNPAEVLTTFDSEGYDEFIIEANIPVYSFCEHHLAPFIGVAHVGYLPNKVIVGLSKLSRLVDIFAHRLQVQERMTVQIANTLQDLIGAKGVGVIVQCRHMCMESRGIQRTGTLTTTSAVRGVVFKEPHAKAEFISLVDQAIRRSMLSV